MILDRPILVKDVFFVELVILAVAIGLQLPCNADARPGAGSGTLSLDFGTLEAAHTTTISVPFTVCNTSTRALVINNVISSCGCAAAVLGSNAKIPVVLPSHASISIRVNIDSYHVTPGSVDKSVSIYAAGYKSPIAILHVTGTIIPPDIFSPLTLDFGPLAEGQPSSVKLTLNYPDSLTKSGTVALTSSDNRFTVEGDGECQSTSPHAHIYTVHLNPSHSIGRLSGRLTAVLHSTNGTQKDIELGDIPCFAKVQGEIDALPHVVSFGQVLKGSPGSQTVLISGNDLEKVTATSLSPNISVVLG